MADVGASQGRSGLGQGCVVVGLALSCFLLASREIPIYARLFLFFFIVFLFFFSHY
jgi:hypothetical protein